MDADPFTSPHHGIIISYVCYYTGSTGLENGRGARGERSSGYKSWRETRRSSEEGGENMRENIEGASLRGVTI